MLLPTPSYRDTKGRSESPARHEGSGVQLPDAVLELLPTPRVGGAEEDPDSWLSRNEKYEGKNGVPLDVAVKVDWGKFAPAWNAGSG